MTTISTEVRLSDKTCLIPEEDMGPAVWRRANSFWNPLGPTPAEAFILMTRGDFEDIKDRESHRLTFNDNMDGETGRLVEFSELYVVKASGVFTSTPERENSAVMVELTDARGIAQRFNDSGTITHNVRSYASGKEYLTPRFEIEGAKTWQQLVDKLIAAMRLLTSVTLPQRDAAAQKLIGTPENWRFNGESAWDGLSEVLAKLGLAFRQTSTGSSIVTLGEAESLPDNLPTPIRDDRPVIGVGVTIPETVRVHFTNFFRSYGQERDSGDNENWSMDIQRRGTAPTATIERGVHSRFPDLTSGFFIDIHTRENGSVFGTIKSLRDDLQRVLDENNEVENDDEVFDRAQHRADVWLRDAKIEPAHIIYPGIHGSLVPTGTIKSVYYRAWGEGDGGGTATEIIVQPGLLTSREFMPAVPSGNLAPPDLSRKSFPNYPRVTNMVQILPRSGYIRPISTDSGYVFSGAVVRWVSDELKHIQSCWIRIPDDNDLSAGNAAFRKTRGYHEIMSGKIVMGRLCGIKTVNDDTRPLYIAAVSKAYGATFNADDLTISGSAVFDWKEISLNENRGVFRRGARRPNADGDFQPMFDLGGDGGRVRVGGVGMLRMSYKVDGSVGGDDGSDVGILNANFDSFEARIILGNKILEGRNVIGNMFPRDAFGDNPESTIQVTDSNFDTHDRPVYPHGFASYSDTATCPPFLFEVFSGGAEIGLQVRRIGGNKSISITNSFLTVEFAWPNDVQVRGEF